VSIRGKNSSEKCTTLNYCTPESTEGKFNPQEPDAGGGFVGILADEPQARKFTRGRSLICETKNPEARKCLGIFGNAGLSCFAAAHLPEARHSSNEKREG